MGKTMANTIHGFYYDLEMYITGDPPHEGDWPDFTVFRAFVYDTAEEAIQHQKEQEHMLVNAGRKMAQDMNTFVFDVLTGNSADNTHA